MVVLDGPTRLATSAIWAWQLRYYETVGIDAWRSETVPHYITNNPVLAGAYARVVLAFMRDRAPSPLRIVELGGGSGRFAFQFLTAFSKLHEASALRHVPFRYVLTDFSEHTIASWREHEALAPFVRRGILELARVDLEAMDTLAAAATDGPLVVIANYVLCGLRQDVFRVRGGRLEECRLTVVGRTDDARAPDALDGVKLLHGWHATERAPYDDPALDAIVDRCRAARPEASVVVPVAAIGMIAAVRRLARSVLMLVADRGDRTAMAPWTDDVLNVRVYGGAISLPVDLDALGRHVENGGGVALSTIDRPAHLAIAAWLLGEHARACPDTVAAFRDAVDRVSPADVFALQRGLRAVHEALDAPALIALLRLTGGDPRVAQEVAGHLGSRLDDLWEGHLEQLRQVLREVWEQYFHLGEPEDLPFALAALWYRLGDYAQAVALFERSLAWYGDDARTRWNLSLCHRARGDEPAAAAQAAAAVRLDPVFRPPPGNLASKSVTLRP